jgi:transposase InsO family protein
MSTWQEIILQHNFDIIYRPGVLNVLPDHFSRLFPTELWPEPGMPIIQSSAEHITSCYMHILQNADEHASRMTVEEEDRPAILEEAHGIGHSGCTQMIRYIHENNQTWPLLVNDCLDFIKSCRACQRYNIAKKGYHPMKSIHAELPGEHIAIDLAGPFTPSTETTHKDIKKIYTHILIVVDICTRFVYLRSLRDSTAITVARKLFKLFCDIGFPKILQSDNGTEFVNQVLTHLTQNMEIQHRLTTPYHPRANGAAERQVKNAVDIIRKRFEDNVQQWHFQVPVAQLALNSKIVSLHQSSPYSLFFARRYNGIGNYEFTESQLANNEQLLERLKYMTEVVFPGASEKARETQQKMIERFNKSAKQNQFPDGSVVMALDPIKSDKLSPKYDGPFTIVRKDRNGAYVLKDSTGEELHRKYAPSQLKIVLVEPDEPSAYVVQKILNHKAPSKTQKEWQYLVRWKNYKSDSDTWEPYSHFNETKCIRDYWRNINNPNPHSTLASIRNSTTINESPASNLNKRGNDSNVDDNNVNVDRSDTGLRRSKRARS